MIDNEKLMSKDLSHLKMIFLGVIYRQKVIDNKGDKWSLKIRCWGVFKPIVIFVSEKL